LCADLLTFEIGSDNATELIDVRKSAGTGLAKRMDVVACARLFA